MWKPKRQVLSEERLRHQYIECFSRAYIRLLDTKGASTYFDYYYGWYSQMMLQQLKSYKGAVFPCAYEPKMAAQWCTNPHTKSKTLIYRRLDFKISAQIMIIVVQIRLFLCKSKYLCRICADLCGLSATKVVFVQTRKASIYWRFKRFVHRCAVLCRHFLAHTRVIN